MARPRAGNQVGRTRARDRSRSRAGLGVIALALSLIAPIHPAQANALDEAMRAAVVPLTIEGDIVDVDQDALEQSLIAGLKRGSFEVVGPEELAGALDERCKDANCWRAFAKRYEVTHIVRPTVQAIERDYRIEVELVDGRSGQTIARSRQSCEICGIADAQTLLETASATLRTKLDALTQSPASVAVVSTPSGAIVALDGEVVGTTPLERQVLTGKHVLRVSKDGFITVEREVTFVEGVSESLQFQLEKVPSRLPPRPWGWVTLATGVASVGAAVAFAALRERPYRIGGACSGDNVDDDGDCRQVWNTEWHVLGFALGGAALTTLGAAILVSSRRPLKAKAGRVEVQARGFGVQGKF